MYHPGKTQTNLTFSGMQRTFYPKHVSYFGDGTGRDAQITMANGGLNRVDKVGMGHSGVHFYKYKSNVTSRGSPSPRKEATTFYYQSDGTGRDSYVLKNNGGLRMEYNVRNSGDRIFKDSLRSDTKSNFYSNQKDITADFHQYQNWNSLSGRKDSIKKSRIQKDLIHRLTTGSPSREHTINYMIGSGDKYQIGQGNMGETRRHSKSTF